MMEEMKALLPEGIKCLFISSVAQQGLNPLKDEIWKAINE